MVWALMRRGVNEIVRVPGAAIPGVLAPTIFMLGLTSVFGNLTLLPGFTTDDYMTFILPVGFLQGAGFTGAATGVNLARDIELGWFDRLLASPAPRSVLLAGTVLSASFRAVMPMTLLIIVGLSLGANFPGIDGLLLGIFFAAIFAVDNGVLLGHARAQVQDPGGRAADAGGRLHGRAVHDLVRAAGAARPAGSYDVAKYNPVTQILEAIRQGFVGDVTWADTWPGARSRWRASPPSSSRSRCAGCAAPRLEDRGHWRTRGPPRADQNSGYRPGYSCHRRKGPGASNIKSMAQRVDTIDIDSLHLRSGGGARFDTLVRVEPVEHRRSAVRGSARGGGGPRGCFTHRLGFAFRMRFDAPLAGPCMRCLTDAEPVVSVDAREVEQPGDAEDFHSPTSPTASSSSVRGRATRSCLRSRRSCCAARTAAASARSAART